MAKNKLQRFSEMETFSCVFQPDLNTALTDSFLLKGKWNELFFKNTNPIVLELGCGKGEYTIGLAEKYLECNFIGVDIKGARMWRGAKTATEKKMPNVAFLRTRIELIYAFFASNEVSEIWLTFPDPQANRKKRISKRLSSSKFLNSYKSFLVKDATIHLKTDSDILYAYTAALVEKNNLTVLVNTSDLYKSGITDDILSIRTHYEALFMAKGQNIKYLKFVLPDQEIVEPDEEFVEKEGLKIIE
ncbi:MAG: tRNA (guanosine(46)-N7)-methyltransferase TrmB [Bacteroidetes bacterium RIFOXYA12_FULL_35_11]|nr:MAG: tRNA (guanosine(46)-N7)-methyltransferase TrmB [Bacteroidetes bacterium GWF2_35_48]OFY75259.1 MAG: tRNA (guanosine(46)-N7)-methyltransferase TrmB [Bacteroidetes bacterium RIFOXYA12_FULL_35_11]OFY96561.1 MAG: tRNA (guanosine(46)-N7)-methyltransferase TrmB [Bacteroidetes bacterium RIFOXYB2_FULL_35_7]OFY99353.1 MAG: tRNA (guanosine(46)-N7)-methyltransferase TrmB [Bacteroidetes bacterium RIFOXYC12_FULL_35_7]HBX51011.1 tRNA (guanosine(46)-N7)-methyltransferase TrmB [Bacteroidales bacterium]